MAAAVLGLSPAPTIFSARSKSHLRSTGSSRALAFPPSSPHPKIPTFSSKAGPLPAGYPTRGCVWLQAPGFVPLSSSPAAVSALETGEKHAGAHGKRALLCALVWAALTFVSHVACGASLAADDAIKASGFGLKVATALRKSGWADEAVVFTLAALPVLELRGAIPVGYWMQLDPLYLTVLAILGNMVPVPFIILYLKRMASFFSQRSASATRLLDLLIERARQKAEPVAEFQWLGLMLFVAVPFPGTGAWTGAIVASVLGMPFWSAVSANFVGVVLAGLLVNLLMNLGLKYAIVTGLVLFLASTVMWSALRLLKKAPGAK